VIFGGSGLDTIHGGVGNDTMEGGTQADTFLFDVVSGGQILDGDDIIPDFETGIDKLSLTGIFDAFGTPGGSRAAAVIITTGATDTVITLPGLDLDFSITLQNNTTASITDVLL